MPSNNLDAFMPVLILMGLTLVIVGVTFFISKLLAPSPDRSSEYKTMAYECGELPQGSAWSLFNVRFYVVGLIFIIFDVESALMFPVATVFKKFNELGRGGLVLVEVLIFLAILICGIAYCWSKGDLDWVRSYQVSEDEK